MDRVWRRWRVVAVLLVLAAATSQAHLCDVTSGQGIIILDITESTGEQTDQSTTPEELPVEGEPGVEVELQLAEGGQEYFTLEGRRLRLLKPLDRDALDLSTIRLQVSCVEVASGAERGLPVIVRVTDINDNPPTFQQLPYVVTVPESTSVGTTIFSQLHAEDIDAGVNGQVEYHIVPGGGDSDGYGVFSINLPHQGLVTLNTSLDYERTPTYLVTIEAVDTAQPASSRLSATTTLTVNVGDVDDQDPVFEYQDCTRLGSFCASPSYTASVTSGEVSGVLGIKPERIRALDRDSLDSPIRYSFQSGRPGNYDHYFSINPRSGAVTHTKPVDRDVIRKFEIVVQATEQGPNKRFATARLVIDVQGIDSSPPLVQATSYSGSVSENAPPGTPVYDDYPDPRPITLSVTDPDLSPGDEAPNYTWELTTTAFRIDPQGTLVVADDTLDRDPPNPGVHTFQVVAREEWEGGVASAPVTLTVELVDVNDNPPRLPVLPPVAVQAGAAQRLIAQITSTDLDAGENAAVSYSIQHVSGGGAAKFALDGATGELRLVDAVDAGEQYSITIRATDSGGLWSQGIQEVVVSRGPNTGGPVFSRPRYAAEVSEGAALNSAIITLTAVDPEGDAPRFSLVSGNEMRHFTIGDTSGTVRLVAELDRETLDGYTLVVKAEDPEGLSTTATLEVSVADLNDKNPEFLELPYSFRVDEGVEGALVGSVKAEDQDLGVFGEVLYSVPEDDLFNITEHTGEIRTKAALDYEKQQVHYLVVTARDGAQDPRLSTATVTVLVSDVGDEAPTFPQQLYEALVPEGVTDALVTTVQAVDPDTIPEISYALVSGGDGLFSVDAASGRVTTLAGLDYETQPRHTLIVATRENPSGPGGTCTVLVTVEDRNDNPPVFSAPVPPLSVLQGSPPGTPLATVIATDADGTKANSEVRYELTGDGRAAEVFAVDATSGVVTVDADLEAEQDSEFQLTITARDGGQPPLSAETRVAITILRPGVEPSSQAPRVFAQFADAAFTASVREDVEAGYLVKKVAVLDRPDVVGQLRCEIVEGDDEGYFGTSETGERHCGVVARRPLDYEVQKHYTLTLALTHPPADPQTPNRRATVEVNVLDVNDNAPVFDSGGAQSSLAAGTYFTFVTQDTPVHTSVLTLKATDLDSEDYGKVHYEIVPETNRGGYFSIGGSSGTLATARDLTSVPYDLLPFNLTVVARDGGEEGMRHATKASVIVNLVGESHRLVLVVAGAPDAVQDTRDDLTAVLQEHTQHVVGIEKVASRRYLGNGSVEVDTAASDVWFYVVNPLTGKLLDRSHPDLVRLSKGEAKSEVLYHVTAALQGMRATDIRSPLVLQKQVIVTTRAPPARKADQLDRLQMPLIVLAGVIAVLGMLGICYICVLWKRYVRHRREEEKAVVVVAPPYERVGSVIEPLAKEYEVQVLHMSVPMDDESVQELAIEPRQPHHFSMDNVSYITKHQLSEDGSTLSRGSLENPNLSHLPIHGRHHDLGMEWSSGRNPAYEHFGDDDDMADDDGPLSVSATNENVMFGRRGIVEPSPVQTTTEL